MSHTTTATRLNVKFILLQQISVLGVPTIVVLSQGEPAIVEAFKPFSLASHMIMLP
jgi:protein-disulfide isomerase-like protein with CxxC motif